MPGLSDSEAIRARVVVSGIVQGVWFRGTCRDEADALGVTGWVRNNPDGTVEAVFEGPTGAVEQLVAWCRVGPSLAYVHGVEVTFEEPRGERRFRVV